MSKRIAAIVALVVAVITAIYLGCRSPDAKTPPWFERVFTALHDVACEQPAPVISSAPRWANELITYVHDAACRPTSWPHPVDAGVDGSL